VPSGTIFARFKIRGKQVRRSLETTNLELAKRKLVELEWNERIVDDDRTMTISFSSVGPA
jgi:hypothetical protein